MSEEKQIVSINERSRKQYKKWISYYRKNIHRFCKDFMGLRLKTFQKINIYQMNKVDVFMYLAARGQSKSYTIAAFCVARCILYPKTEVTIASGTKKQAKLIITEKIQKDFMRNEKVRNEISEIKTVEGDLIVYFKNGSTITAVVSSDNSRGYRSSIMIYEEARMIKEHVIKTVLAHFLNATRELPFKDKEEYKNYPKEVGKEIYISSAWYKNDWMYKKYLSLKKQMVDNYVNNRKQNVFVVALPWQLSYSEGLLPKERVISEYKDESFSQFSWDMEMECLFVGEKEGAFFTLNSLDGRRTLEKAFYPFTELEYAGEFKKTKTKRMPKANGEIRLIGMDIALMGGDRNDQTVYTLYRLLPNGTYYRREVPYIETLSGAHSEKQAIRLKQLFHDFDADFVVMDTLGNGMSVYDDCAKVLYDSERDIEYPAWCAMNNEEMAKRALDSNAVPLIYSVKAVKAELNHEMAMSLKDAFEKGRIKLLTHELVAKEFLEDKFDYAKKDKMEQIALMHPYIQTSLLVSEMINLTNKMTNGLVRLDEGNGRKDRYSSLSYVNYYAKQLELKLNDNDDIWSNIDVNSIIKFIG